MADASSNLVFLTTHLFYTFALSMDALISNFIKADKLLGIMIYSVFPIIRGIG